MPPFFTKTKRQTSQKNKRRKGLLAVLIPLAKRFGLFFVITLSIAWLGAWVVLSGAASRFIDWTENQVILASAKAGFVVDDLLVEGRVNADAAFLLALLNVQKGDPLFGVSPAEAKKLLQETEWIKAARVERRLPSTLYIKLTERKPTALWRYKKETGSGR